jgi:hypothetical protein
MAVSLTQTGVTLTSANVSLEPTTPNLPWQLKSESLLGGVSLTAGLIQLSNATVTAASSVGTVVGDFSVVNGSTRTYTFTLTTGTSLFTVTNSTLAVGAALSAGSVSITAQASDTGTSVISGTFLITIISTAAPSIPAMQFNTTLDSQYIPLMSGIG